MIVYTLQQRWEILRHYFEIIMVTLQNVCQTNRCYYGLNGQLSNRDLSRATKLILYKTLILPVLLYGAKAWT